MQSVLTSVPATTANLGPGYDCLGVALQISNRVLVTQLSEEHPAAETLQVKGPQAGEAMATLAADRFFSKSGRRPFHFQWSVEGDVPLSRGMGSSVTVRLGLLAGLNILSNEPLTRHEIFELCADLEGHPDNAAPAAFGGFTVAGGVSLARFEVSSQLAFVLLIPDFEVATPAARRVLPAQLERLSAVASCANACRITAAFASKNYNLLRGAFVDGLHQPFRRPLIPFLDDVISAGEKAGALGGFLSGSGSTICCVSLENPELVAQAMASAAPGNVRTVVTHADNLGMVAKLVDEKR